jgi:hypothetical protein
MKIKELIANGTITHDDVMEYLDDCEQQSDSQDSIWDLDVDTNPYLPDSEYVLISTSEELEESYVFPCDELGNISSGDTLAEVTKRFLKTQDLNAWKDMDYVLENLTANTGHTYEYVKHVFVDIAGIIQKLYKRTDL